MTNNITLGAMDEQLANENATVKEILAIRSRVRRMIADNAYVLEEQLEAIMDRGYDQPLNHAQLKQVEELNNALISLSHANKEISLITVRLLNESAEVQRMINTLTAVNKGLERSVAKVKRVADMLKSIGDVIGLIDRAIGVFGKLSGLLA